MQRFTFLDQLVMTLYAGIIYLFIGATIHTVFY